MPIQRRFREIGEWSSGEGQVQTGLYATPEICECEMAMAIQTRLKNGECNGALFYRQWEIMFREAYLEGLGDHGREPKKFSFPCCP